MSAPAGWHLQPDGQERYWDGQQWTEHVRAPLASDPTAPPEWAASSQETQAVDLAQTTAIPALEPVADPSSGSYAAADPSAAPQSGAAAPQQGYGAPQQGYGSPQQGYGSAQPGYAPQQPAQPAYGPPPPTGTSGAAKGCLIAALVGFFIVAVVVAGGLFFFARTVDRVVETFPTSFPSDFPTTLPTDGPGSLDIEISAGEGFDLPRVRVEDGWTVGGAAGPLDIMTISGMSAVPTQDDGLPVLFTMAFEVDDSTTVETVCTAPGGPAGTPVEVRCVPLLGNVEDARRITVTGAL